mmetsp:Transcript_18325/g.56857  ORF Transcript_18325/g.56857 Transcript_18325/m.56857 type:complete len:232 (+) Transcript_18325:1541-2236(+)
MLRRRLRHRQVKPVLARERHAAPRRGVLLRRRRALHGGHLPARLADGGHHLVVRHERAPVERRHERQLEPVHLALLHPAHTREVAVARHRVVVRLGRHQQRREEQPVQHVRRERQPRRLAVAQHDGGRDETRGVVEGGDALAHHVDDGQQRRGRQHLGVEPRERLEVLRAVALHVRLRRGGDGDARVGAAHHGGVGRREPLQRRERVDEGRAEAAHRRGGVGVGGGLGGVG